MSDDRRRDEGRDPSGGYGTDFGDEFGTVSFGASNESDTDEQPTISFGKSDTGPLPHWSEPPTGELPRFIDEAPSGETDVWSSFGAGDDTTRTEIRPADSRPVRRDITADGPLFGDSGSDQPTASAPVTPPPVFDDEAVDISGAMYAQRDRVAIGGDYTDERRRPVQRGGSSGQTRRPARATTSDRDMPTAVTAGLVIAAVFLAALLWKPAAAVVFVVVALGLASVEFYSKVSERGYRPASLIGTVACVAAPAAAYWLGDGTLPLVMMLAFVAAAVSFVGTDSVQSGPMPNIAITSLGIIWIGLLGSFASLILRLSTDGSGFANAGTDTLLLVAICVVANDTAALFVGKSIGRTKLREWISPNKSVEGLIGGAVATIIAAIIIGSQSDTWNSLGEQLLLGIVIAIAAPLGDLVESMFKRNLDIKDFGNSIAGHGGVLDRFDAFLFVLPSVYYLTVVLEPWVS